jgi:hypothetical protein
MKLDTLTIVAEVALFCLTLLLGGLVAARTGRLWPGVATVWFSLILITIPLALVNLEWANVSTAAAFSKASTAEKEHLHELVNLFPDGSHVLANLFMGWLYGLIPAAIGMRFRRQSTGFHTHSLLKTGH